LGGVAFKKRGAHRITLPADPAAGVRHAPASVATRARVKSSGAPFDDGAGDRDHLGNDITRIVAKLRHPNLVGGAQSEQRMPGRRGSTITARVD